MSAQSAQRDQHTHCTDLVARIVAAVQRERAQLQQRLETLQQQRSEEKEELQGTILSTTRELHNATHETSALREQMSTLQQEVTTLQTSLHQSETQRREALAANEAQKRQFEETLEKTKKDAAIELQSRMDWNEQEFVSLKEVCATTFIYLNYHVYSYSLNSSFILFRYFVYQQKYSSENQILRTSLDAEKGEVDKLKKKLQENEEELTSLQAEKAQNTSLSQYLAEAQQQTASLQSELTQTKAANEELQKASQRSATLSKEVASQYKEEAERIMQEFTKERRKMTDLHAQEMERLKQQHAKEVSSLNQCCNSLKTQNETLTTQLQRQTTRSNEYKESLLQIKDGIEKELTERNNKITALQNAYKLANEDLTKNKQFTTILEGEMAKYRHVLRHVRGILYRLHDSSRLSEFPDLQELYTVITGEAVTPNPSSS